MQRRLSFPSEFQAPSLLTGVARGHISPALYTTTPVFPDFTPSSQYDQIQSGFYWSHQQMSRRIWEYVIFLVALITPIEISYVLIWDMSIDVKRYSVFFIFDAIQIFDNYVILKTPFLRHGIMIGDVKEILKHYGIWNYIIHILGSLPIGWVGIVTENTILYGICSINRLLRLHQGYKSYKFICDSQAYENSTANIVTSISLFMFVCHIFSCVFYIIALIEGLENSWIKFFHLNQFTREQQYAVSMYFVLTTILTIGFGDIHAVTTLECIVCIIAQIIGVFFEALFIAKMVTSLSDPQMKSFLRRYNTIYNFLRLKKIDKTVRNHVRHYHQHIWDTTHGASTWNELFKSLPVSIKNGIKLEMCNSAFSQMILFYGVRQKYLLQILDAMESMIYLPGQYIYQQGEQSSELLIFKSGLIQVIVNGEPTATEEASRIILDGERQLLFPEVREKTLKALSFVEGWRLKKDKFAIILNSRPTLRKLIYVNAKRSFSDDFSKEQIKEENLWPIESDLRYNEEEEEEETDRSDGEMYLYVADLQSSSDTEFEDKEFWR